MKLIVFALIFAHSILAAEQSKFSSTVQKYSRSWQIVDSLIDNGLNSSALHTINNIYKIAKISDSADEMIKALIYRIKLESLKEEDAYVKALKRIISELIDAKFPVSPVLHSMLAEMYWHYYQNNRWRFYNRTHTNNIDFKDIHTWDLRTIMEKMTQEYELSLKNIDELKRYSLDKYNAIIESRSADTLRPTLYDFLAHRAVDFFSLGDNELAKPAFEFTLNSSDFFLPFDKFSKLDIRTQDTASLKYHALQMLKDLILFHENDNKPNALIDVDLKRLSFVRQHAVLANKDSLYLTTLQALEKRFAGSSASTEVTYQIALLKNEWAQTFVAHQDERYRWMNRDALALCRKALSDFPNSYGSLQCKALVSQITVKDMSFKTESVELPGKPFKVLFTYKNVKRVFWRQIKIGYEEYQNILHKSDFDKVLLKLTKLKPIKEWSTSIPCPEDYQNHSVELEMPSLSTGHYIILCASDSNFTCEKQAVACNSLQISRLSYIQRCENNNDQKFYFLDRESGNQLQGVTVNAWIDEYDANSRENKKVAIGTFQSDNEGHVVVPMSNKNHRYNYCRIDCSKGDDHLYSDQQYYQSYYTKQKQTMSLRTFFFTDRVIYRPGQIVYFKGITLRTDGEKNEIASGEKTNVKFVNTNGQEVAQLNLITNKYGSFHGSFTAPTNSLNGMMSIANDNGSIWFSVEDYKRPKFEVTIDPFKGANRLGDTIHVTGFAKAYSGSFIDGAVVKYSVVRRAQFPVWWWCPTRRASEMEICSGTAISNDTGGFKIDFLAIPDMSIPRTENPTFSYKVNVDITDITGETRSTSGLVNVGYSALALDLGIGQNVRKESELSFPITTANLNGTFEPAKGTIIIYRLKPQNKIFRKRLWNTPDTTVMTEAQHELLFKEDLYGNENDVRKFPKAEKVFENDFDTQKSKILQLDDAVHWKTGIYILEAQAKDKFGQEVKDIKYFTLFSDQGIKLPFVQTDWFVPVKDQCEPGEKAVFLLGSGYSDTKVLYEIEHKHEIVKKEWIRLNNEQKRIEIPIEEKHRGNLFVHITFVHSNRSYQHTEAIVVPWTNKDLDISFETFRDKLSPGEKEEWRMKISGKNKDKIAAEMVATLYDASLDAFRPHHWDFNIYPFFGESLAWNVEQIAQTQTVQVFDNGWNNFLPSPYREYPSLNWFGFTFKNRHDYGFGRGSQTSFEVKSMPRLAKNTHSNVNDLIGKLMDGSTNEKSNMQKGIAGTGYGSGFGFGGLKDEPNDKASNELPKQDLTNITTRANLNETAFFYPILETNENGEIIVKFQIPEALTKWKMLGFAHTQDLKYGMISKEIITQKDLMVIPNPPRVFRENDSIRFTARVSNLSDSALTGSAQLFLFDAANMKPIDKEFSNNNALINFTCRKGQSVPLAWNIAIPEGVGAVTFKAVAKANNFSDGEEQIIPVLSNKMLVTESIPLSIRKIEARKFTLPTLVSQNNGSSTLSNYKLTLEFTSNPAWYAIQALPYLIEYPYACAEQMFGQFYANSIAAHIANSSPKIKAIFEQWKSQSPDALLSNLEKNQELKALALEETPWLFDGKSESERKKRISLLFDINALADGKERSLSKLMKLQMSNGGWPWFEGGPDDRFITQYIAIGIGRLDHIGMLKLRDENELSYMTKRCIDYLDNRIRKDYESILKNGHSGEDNLSEIQIQYLYMRSYFKDYIINNKNRAAFDYFIDQSKKYWLQKRRYLQGMIALTLNRYEDKNLSLKVIRSLKENALVSEEMGMYWKEMHEGNSCRWYQAPIESQALMVELFYEVAHDVESVENLKLWLIKSKQTQNWQTTKATAEACYALLLRGENWLENQSTVSVTLGDTVVDASNGKNIKAEAGTGYFKKSWTGSDINPGMGNIKISKKDSGAAWGALYWQYFEQLDKINHYNTPLKLNKKLYIQQNSSTGTKISLIDRSTLLRPGDKLTVRLELEVDRDLEYVHMKDMRASGFEPLNVFSGFRWQDGLGYYESTRDASTNFFFSYLKKGTYVFEYPMVVTHSGDFSNGVATIQSMYAPEFTSHSEGMRVRIGK